LTGVAQEEALRVFEPVPDYATVFLATTDNHVFGETLTRRCKWLRLHSIPTRLIAARLRVIVGAKLDDGTLNEIARVAHGNLGAAINDADTVLDGLEASWTLHEEKQALKTLGRHQPAPREVVPRRNQRSRPAAAPRRPRARGRPSKESERERAINEVTRDGQWHAWSDVLRYAGDLGVNDTKGMQQTRDRLEAAGGIEVDHQSNPRKLRQCGV
jgi:hypothetical protein